MEVNSIGIFNLASAFSFFIYDITSAWIIYILVYERTFIHSFQVAFFFCIEVLQVCFTPYLNFSSFHLLILSSIRHYGHTWKFDCEEVICKSKQRLINASILHTCDITKPIFVEADSSNFAIRAALLQLIPDTSESGGSHLKGGYNIVVTNSYNCFRE